MERPARMRIAVILLSTMICATGVANAAGDYWPTWRGPQATGTAPTGNPPTAWSESKNIKWKVALPGKGSSSPVIWADKIFFLAAIDTQEPGTPAAEPAPAEAAADSGRRGRGRGNAPKTIHTFDVICLDRATGKLLWQKTARKELPHEGHHPTGSLASYSPLTDGKYVWASFGSRGLYCYDLEGNLKWSQELPQMKIVAGFGEGSSAALAGDAVIVVCDHEGESAIFAFNKETGDLLWRKDRDEGTSWATPVPVEVDGKLQVITNATGFIRSYDVKTGDVIWQCSGQTRNVIPTPVLGFGKVFCTSGYRGNALQAIELGRTGDLSGSDAIAWKIDKATPYVPSPALHGGKIYVCSSNNPIVSCYDAQTGAAHFVEQKLEDIKGVYASPVGVADRVYFAGRNGVTVVLKNSDTFEVLATNTLDDGFDASPAIVGDELYLKGNESFYCIANL